MTFALQDAKLWDPQEDRRNSRKQKTMMRIGRSASINGGRRFETLIWMYERLPRRYQGCVPIQYRKNFLLLKPQPNVIQKNSGTGSRNVTLQNFASKWSALDKLHGIRHSERKNVNEYMSRIKNASAKIDDLKISISKAVVIHAFNNLDSHFRPNLAILSHDTQEIGKLPTLSELTKTLEDKEIRLSNENKGTANFAYSSKSKPKLSDQKNKRDTEKDSQPNSDKKIQENKECQTFGGIHTKRLFTFED